MTRRLYITENNVPAEALTQDLLFDTNIWLAIYGVGVDTSNHQTRVYSAFHKKALEAKRTIYLLNTITSEYIHVSLKLLEKISPHRTIAEKIHQQQSYSSWMENIANEVSYLTDECVKLSDEFEHSDPEAMCRRCCGKLINYNDIIIADVCRAKSLLLVTDDADFSCEKVDIVTRNLKLVKP